MENSGEKKNTQSTRRSSSSNSNMETGMLQMMNNYENTEKSNKKMIHILAMVLVLSVIVIGVSSFYFVQTINDMHQTYITETEKIIRTRSDIEIANSWERLPVNQRKERLRGQFFEIVRYYNNNVPDEQRMNDEQILNVYNQLWDTTERLPHVNFFLPVAYMRVVTNFNPIYNSEYRYGIAGFYINQAEDIANLPVVRNDPVFMTSFSGITTLNNPTEAIKLLVARIDDLMKTFNNREDWVILALFQDEYNVIRDYWDSGDGAIPDEMYESGPLAETLTYYHSFKNWRIPATMITEE